MTANRLLDRYFQRGVASIMAIQFLVLFATLSVAFAAVANLELQKAVNYRAHTEARLAAETGLTFATHRFLNVQLPPDTTGETFIERLSEVLGSSADVIAYQTDPDSGYTLGALTVPEVEYQEGRTFTGRLAQIGADLFHLRVKGSSRGVRRYLAIDMRMTPQLPRALDYGVASRGPIIIGGSTRIVGVNEPSDADILSATQELDAISVSGSVELSGDLYVTGDGESVTLTGSPSIGGSSDSEWIESHIHVGTAPPEFPTLNIAPIAALTTRVIDSSTDLSKPLFKNIRIAPNTNPTFKSDVVIQGVIYVEAPNVVTFTARATIIGLIVTEDNDLPIETCQIKFRGSLETGGVEDLPDKKEFEAVKEHTGTFLLAPGFGLTVAGNVGMINGLVAADQVTFRGTAEGRMSGPIVSLDEHYTMLMEGNVEILVDRSRRDSDPAGVEKVWGLALIPDSYTELTAGSARDVYPWLSDEERTRWYED